MAEPLSRNQFWRNAPYKTWTEPADDLAPIFDANGVIDQAYAPYTVTATTAQLTDIDHAINTVGKHAGKMVFNTTTGKPVWAVGATAGAVWNESDGTSEHTPA